MSFYKVDSHSVLYILYIFGRDVLSLSFVVDTSTQGMYKNETGDEPRKQDTPANPYAHVGW